MGPLRLLQKLFLSTLPFVSTTGRKPCSSSSTWAPSPNTAWSMFPRSCFHFSFRPVLKSFPQNKPHVCVHYLQGWTWYLSVDMQLFLLAPWLAILRLWRPRAALWVAALLILFNIVYNFALGYSMDLNPIFPAQDSRYQDEIYVKVPDFLSLFDACLVIRFPLVFCQSPGPA